MSRKMSRSSGALDTDLADANVKLSEVEGRNQDLQKAHDAKCEEVETLKKKLAEAEKRTQAAEDKITTTVKPLKIEVENYRRQNAELTTALRSKDAETAKVQSQLTKAQEATTSLQSQLDAARHDATEQKRVSESQLKAALADLASVRNALEQKAAHVGELEREKAHVTAQLAAATQESPDAERTSWLGWNGSSELWLTGAMSACAAAAAVSFLYLRYDNRD